MDHGHCPVCSLDHVIFLDDRDTVEDYAFFLGYSLQAVRIIDQNSMGQPHSGSRSHGAEGLLLSPADNGHAPGRAGHGCFYQVCKVPNRHYAFLTRLRLAPIYVLLPAHHKVSFQGQHRLGEGTLSG